jgi:glycosyltransferase involved in cell wall biosynthesis|tara:strand:+ start:139 stop:1164 length:1026 start_codon:yes stop_codon:yes gene_type:complete
MEYPLISIVIPNKDDWNFVLNLGKVLQNQTYQNFELIVVDSSQITTDNSAQIKALNLLYPSNLTIHKSRRTYPGQARNIGASIAHGVYIAFMDAKTIPHEKWLESYLETFLASSSELIIGTFESSDEKLNWLQRAIKANTYGNILRSSVPGSLLLKTTFWESKGFNEKVGAGEDLEWVERLKKLNWSISQAPITAFEYIGYPNALTMLLKKWIFYSIENAKLNILATQKSLYFLLLSIFLLYFIYSWNYLFTNGLWDASPNFIPNLNTIIWSVTFLVYFLFRAIILPLHKKERFFYIFPFHWILIGCVGLLIDVLKIPGRIYGVWRIIKSTSDISSDIPED